MYDKTHISPAVTAAQAVLLNPSHVAQHPGGARAFVPLFPNVNPRTSTPSKAAAAGAVNGHGDLVAVAATTAGDFEDGDSSADDGPSTSSAPPSGHHRSSGGSAVRHSAAYGSLSAVRGYELQFTMDRVVLDINGADADLTVVDLPGASGQGARVFGLGCRCGNAGESREGDAGAAMFLRQEYSWMGQEQARG